MKKRYADLDKIIREIEKLSEKQVITAKKIMCNYFLQIAENAEVSNVEKVIHCRDCYYFIRFNGRDMCKRHARKHGESWHGLVATDSEHFCGDAAAHPVYCGKRSRLIDN